MPLEKVRNPFFHLKLCPNPNPIPKQEDTSYIIIIVMVQRGGGGGWALL